MDRLREPRFPTIKVVTVSGEAQEISGLMLDQSENGMRVRAPHAHQLLREGQNVAVHTPEKQIQACVVWVKKDEIGLNVWSTV